MSSTSEKLKVLAILSPFLSWIDLVNFRQKRSSRLYIGITKLETNEDQCLVLLSNGLAANSYPTFCHVKGEYYVYV